MLGGAKTLPWRNYTVLVCGLPLKSDRTLSPIICAFLQRILGYSRRDRTNSRSGESPSPSLVTRVCAMAKFYRHCDLVPWPACTPLPGSFFVGPSVLGSYSTRKGSTTSTTATWHGGGSHSSSTLCTSGLHSSTSWEHRRRCQPGQHVTETSCPLRPAPAARGQTGGGSGRERRWRNRRCIVRRRHSGRHQVRLEFDEALGVFVL